MKIKDYYHVHFTGHAGATSIVASLPSFGQAQERAARLNAEDPPQEKWVRKHEAWWEGTRSKADGEKIPELGYSARHHIF